MTLDMNSITCNYYVANYYYNKVGNLMGDDQDGLSNISWNVYGKIRSITKTNGTTINYKYDPSGNRIEKSVTSAGVNVPKGGKDIITQAEVNHIQE